MAFAPALGLTSCLLSVRSWRNGVPSIALIPGRVADATPEPARRKAAGGALREPGGPSPVLLGATIAFLLRWRRTGVVANWQLASRSYSAITAESKLTCARNPSALYFTVSSQLGWIAGASPWAHGAIWNCQETKLGLHVRVRD